jgi:hypothetical protein
MNTQAFPKLVAIAAATAVLALAGCSSSTAKTASAPTADASAPVVPGSPGSTPTVGATAKSAPTGKAVPTPAVKQLIHYSVAATHQCSWSTTKAGHLVISLGFQITAKGKTPPAEVAFAITDGAATATVYEPVGTPFQAVLDSGKPAAGNPWVGKVVTVKVTVNGGQANAAHGSLTLNGPIANTAAGDTYCPAA